MRRRTFLAASGAALLSAAPAWAQAGRAFSAARAYSAARSPSALIIARHGIVLAESYVGARTETLWDLGLAGHVFTPILAAAMVADRSLNLNEPVAMTLGDWGAHPTKRNISIRMLLNGSSGIAAPGRDDLTLDEAVALEPVAEPGRRFIDDRAPYVLFGEIARRKLAARGRALDIAAFLKSRVLDDIGCAPMTWGRTREGAPMLDDGMQTSLRAWAQAGELLRRDGIYRARELLSRQAILETRQGSFAEPRAGIGLWLMGAAGRGASAPEMRAPSDLWRTNPTPPADLVMTAGAQGQRMYVAPSLGLVVARAGQGGERWSDAAFLGAVLDDI